LQEETEWGQKQIIFSLAHIFSIERQILALESRDISK
jgi:hypothetical protein